MTSTSPTMRRFLATDQWQPSGPATSLQQVFLATPFDRGPSSGRFISYLPPAAGTFAVPAIAIGRTGVNLHIKVDSFALASLAPHLVRPERTNDLRLDLQTSYSVRLCSTNDPQHSIVINGVSSDGEPLEIGFAVDPAQAERLAKRGLGAAITSNVFRQNIPGSNLVADVHVFGGRNDGLVVFSVPVEEGAEIPKTPWLGEEITEQADFQLEALAARPYAERGLPENIGAAL